MKNQYPKNIRVYAYKNQDKTGFNIYLSFSGKKEYLCFHRANGPLYRIIANGISLSDLYRWKPNKVSRLNSKKLENSMKYLLRTIEAFIDELYDVA